MDMIARVKMELKMRMIEAAYNLALSRGMACQDDIALLQELCLPLCGNKTKPTIIQLGAGSGTMALAVLGMLPEAGFLSVDIDRNNIGWEMKALENAGYEFNDYNPVIGLSWQIGSAYKGPMIDLLIVDADHTYGAVCRDLYAWTPKVHGNIFVHDYDGSKAPRRYPGVALACDALLIGPWHVAGWSAVFKADNG